MLHAGRVSAFLQTPTAGYASALRYLAIDRAKLYRPSFPVTTVSVPIRFHDIIIIDATPFPWIVSSKPDSIDHLFAARYNNNGGSRARYRSEREEWGGSMENRG